MSRKTPKAGKRRTRKPVKVSSPRQSRMFCPCKGRCCSAAGVRCACACHGRNHGTGPRANPPVRTRTVHVKPKVYRFARALRLTYRRADGKAFYHDCGPGAQIYAPANGAPYLVIKGVNVKRFLEG